MLRRFLIFILFFIPTSFCFGQEDGGRVDVPAPILTYFKTAYPKVTHVKWIYDGYSPEWLQDKAVAYRANFNYSATNVFMHIDYAIASGVAKVVLTDSTVVPMSIMNSFHSYFPNTCYPDWYCHHYPQYPSTREGDTMYQAYFDYNYLNMMFRPAKDSHPGVHFYPLLETIKQLTAKIPTLVFNEDSTGYKFAARKVAYIHKPADSIATCKLDFYRNFNKVDWKTFRISGDMNMRDSLTYCTINITDSLLFSDMRIFASDYKVFTSRTFVNPDSVKSWPPPGVSVDDTNFLPEKIKLYIKKKLHKCRYGCIGIDMDSKGAIEDIHIQMINRKEKISDMEFDNHSNLTMPPSKFYSEEDDMENWK